MGSEIWMVFLLLMPSLISCSACSLEEQNSLLDFKQGINFTYYREYQLVMPLESWRGLNCCSWEGVGCHPHSGHVITLDLGLSYIQWSEVRGGLFQLLHLEHLDLSHNDFTSLSIPPQFGELRRLKYSSLLKCEFSGQIPRKLTKLQKLEHLDLSENDLYGAIPREMGNISTLKFLDLSENAGFQSNKLGDWITRLRGLEHLGLSGMNLTMAEDTRLEQMRAFRRNSSLLCKSLTPSVVGPSGKFIQSTLSNLEYLDLSSNKLNGSIPPTLGNLSKLGYLRLSSNKLNGSIPSTLGNLLALNFLELENNSLSGPIPTSFAKLSKLEVLDLANNRLNGTFSFFILNSCTKHTALDLSSNTLTVEVNDYHSQISA